VPQIVEFPLDGGGSVQVEVAPTGAVAPAGHAKLVTVAQRTLQEALEPIRPVAVGVLRQMKDLAESPDKISMEFGVKLSAEAGLVVARGTTEANFVVKLEWSRPGGAGGARTEP
jgi:hypothetical protein